jgi:hypothetical protein
VTDTVSNSVTNGDSQGFGVKVGAKGVTYNGELSGNFTWNHSATNGYSTASTFSTAQSEANTLTETLSFSVGNKDEETGSYRLTLIATCDVYLYLKLNKTNTQVVDAVTSVCARPDTYRYVIDYDQAIDGTFGKTSDSGLIQIDPDMYKTLSIPTNSDAPSEDPIAPAVETSKSIHVYDGDSIRVDEKTGQKFTINYPVGLDIAKLTELGYKNITITLSVEIRAQDTGDGRQIWLEVGGNSVWKVENLNVNKTSWYSVSYTVPARSISFFNNSSVFRFGFDTKDYFWTDAIWFFNTADVTFTAVK